MDPNPWFAPRLLCSESAQSDWLGGWLSPIHRQAPLHQGAPHLLPTASEGGCGRYVGGDSANHSANKIPTRPKHKV